MLHSPLRASAHKLLALAFLVFFLPILSVCGQGISLTVTTSTNTTSPGQNLSYFISFTDVTNRILANTVISNVYPANTILIGATATLGTITTNATTGVVFLSVPTMVTGQVAQLTITVQPTANGSLTNVAYAYAEGTSVLVNTNIIQATGGNADLEIRLAGKTSGILTNDAVSTQVTVDNLGPTDASGVALSLSIPSGLQIRSVTPSGLTYSVTNSTLSVSWATLAANARSQFWVHFLATNTSAAALPETNAIIASVLSSGSIDPNSGNNDASLDVVVDTQQPGSLSVSTNSAPKFNPQTGLMEQSVHLINTSTNSVSAARILIPGFSYQVYNAAATNSGIPYLNVNTLVGPAGLDVIVKYFDPLRSLTNSPSFIAIPVSPTTYVLPIAASVGITVFDIPTASQPAYLEFPATTGSSYSIIYADNGIFYKGLLVEPPIIAPGSRVQWFDEGPPYTRGNSTNAPVRFYRVIANP